MANKIIYAILLIAALALAAKVAAILIIGVLVAGFIFRTKETIGLLLLGGFLTALAAAPLITLGGVAVLVTISLIFKAKEKKPAGLALARREHEPEESLT